MIRPVADILNLLSSFVDSPSLGRSVKSSHCGSIGHEGPFIASVLINVLLKFMLNVLGSYFAKLL